MSDLILFVEDNIDLRDSAAHLLELNDFEVWVASDGVEALDKLSSNNRIPDLIVSDISMPHMNGYDFFNAVRERPHWKGIPFIFLTALGARTDIRLGWELGVDDYLVKPFQPEDFLAAVRSRLKRNREMRTIAEQELEETRHMLVRILSHELRTPLTYVTGGFTLLADEINKQEELPSRERQDVETILELIRNGTSRLSHLAEQTVLLSELMSGQTRQHLEKSGEDMPVALIIHSAVSQVKPAAEEKEITLEIGEVADAKVYGLMTLLIHGIGEILTNAIQYSDENTTISIRASADDENQVIIQVKDNGRGIDPADLKEVWDLISQSQRDQYEHQGFGLGLPIVRHIFELHKGSVSMESDVNTGTTVYLKLPVYIEKPAEAG